MPTPLLTLRPQGGPLVERLEWLTDFPAPSRSGAEVRDPLRVYPRHSLEFEASASLFAASPYVNGKAAALAQFRDNNGVWVVPQWQHLARLPAAPRAKDAGEAVVAFDSAWDGTAAAFDAVPGGSVFTAPAGEAWVSFRTASHNSASTLTGVTVEATYLNFREVHPAYTGPMDSGCPVLPVKPDWSEALEEAVAPREDAVDFGQGWKKRRLYTKHSLRFTVHLRGDGIQAFRQFLFQVKGRAGPFVMQAPGHPEPQMYRLDHDAVAIEYRTRNVALCTLTAIEMPLGSLSAP